MTIRLRYLGKHGEWLPNVPASDHDQDDEKAAKALVASGLYEIAEPKVKRSRGDAKPAKPAKPAKRARTSRRSTRSAATVQPEPEPEPMRVPEPAAEFPPQPDEQE